MIKLVLLMLLFVCYTKGRNEVRKALEDVKRFGDRITFHIPSFHQYEYDDFIDPNTKIVDGLFNMYNEGNEIAIWTNNDRPDVITYDETTRDGTNIFGASASYPFMSLWWFTNSFSRDKTLQVRSFPSSPNSIMLSQFNSTINVRGFDMKYFVYQAYGADTPSICEVYFVISNSDVWGSILPENIDFRSLGNKFSFDNRLNLRGNFIRVMAGYTLYSKLNGNQVSRTEIQLALMETLNIIAVSTSDQRPPVRLVPAPTRRPSGSMVEMLMAQADSSRNEIISEIPSFYNYLYDTQNSEIRDGGEDMFDFGNRIRFKQNISLYQQAVYDQVYYFDEYQFYARATHPFLAFLWIENKSAQPVSYNILVSGNYGADQSGEIALFSGRNIRSGGFRIDYEVFQVHNAEEDATVCEVYFTVSSRIWNSTSGVLNILEFSTETDEIVNSVQLSGSPQNVLMGYMLLSKTEGQLITKNEIELALIAMTTAFDDEPATSLVTPLVTITEPSAQQSTTTTSMTPPTSGIELNDNGGIWRICNLPSTGCSTVQWQPLINNQFNGIQITVTGPAEGYIATALSLNRRMTNSEAYYCQNSGIYRATLRRYSPPNDEQLIPTEHVISMEVVDNIRTCTFYRPMSVTNLFRVGQNVTFDVSTMQFNLLYAQGPVTPRNLILYHGVNKRISDQLLDLFVEPLSMIPLRTTQQPSLAPAIQTQQPSTSTETPVSPVSTMETPVSTMETPVSTIKTPVSTMETPVSTVEMPVSTMKTPISTMETPSSTMETPSRPSPSTPMRQPSTTTLTTSRPLSPTTKQPSSNIESPTLDLLAKQIDQVRNEIVSSIPDFHLYDYDGGRSQINDGGSDMYDGGNMVRFNQGSGRLVLATYGQTYRFPKVDFTTMADHPFLGLMWIKDKSDSPENYLIKVEGDLGADGGGQLTRSNGELTCNNFTLKFLTTQVSGADQDPSVCEVYFVIENQQLWNSVPGRSFSTIGSNRLSTNTNQVATTVRVNGRPKNILMGYMLLSRTTGLKVDDDMVQNSLLQVLNSLSDNQCKLPPPSIRDVNFLHSCTLRETINALWKCEIIFNNPVKYFGPNSCIGTMDCLSNCVSSVLNNCTNNGMSGSLDLIQIRGFNTQFFLESASYIRNTSMLGSDPISAFCQTNLLLTTTTKYPRMLNEISICDSFASSNLLLHFTKFYNEFIWALNKDNICSASRLMLSRVIDLLENSCNLGVRSNIMRTGASRGYLQEVFNIGMETLRKLTPSSCNMQDAGNTFMFNNIVRTNRQMKCDCSNENQNDVPVMCRREP